MVNEIKQKINIFNKKSDIHINRLLLFFGFFLLLVTALVILNNHEIIILPVYVNRLLSTITTIIWVYFSCTIFIKITQTQVVKIFDASVDVEQKLLLTKLYTSLIYLIGTTIVLWLLGVTLQNLAIILGLAATGIAFAIREILISYFVWFMLLTKRPFRISDYIKIGDNEGKVVHIGSFYVFLKPISYHPKDSLIKVPNKIFLEKDIFNYGHNKYPIILNVPVKFADDIDHKKAFEKLTIDLKELTKSDTIPILRSEKEYVYILISFFTDQKDIDRLKTDLALTVYKYFKSPK